MKVVVFMLVALAFLAVPALPFQTPQKALLLFGGKDHDVLLGCLNCINLSPSAVCNELGKYGSNLNPNSIWNSLSKFGSNLNDESPWNSLSQHAPIIVDKDGKSYGYFSVNSLHHDRTQIHWVVRILDFYEESDDLDKTRDKMCSDD